ncbi:MAG: 16S rRNA (cytidine(1402)-2'-O)-methyltransferase [Clostridiales bacterium]|nr:16S rRNA (cytidine(1402)-2'-O)-methyltransferase [Clostridiales bacterium]
MELRPSTLYLVGTPIGNLGDLSPRAAEVLGGVSFIAAEDTRVTGKLLRHLGLSTPMVSYHEHNRLRRAGEILPRLLAGETCALCTDAGMPAISDPGDDLVGRCHEAGIAVESVPGPSAVTTALALSGLPAGRFCFEGFLSTGSGSRAAHLEAIRREPRTLVFYEAPHKLLRTLEDLYGALGDRDVALCREMTKLHEQTVRTTLSGALALARLTEPRGEYVLVVAGWAEPAPEVGPQAVEQALREALAQGLTGRDAVRQAAERLGLPRNQVYAQFVQLTREP